MNLFRADRWVSLLPRAKHAVLPIITLRWQGALTHISLNDWLSANNNNNVYVYLYIFIPLDISNPTTMSLLVTYSFIHSFIHYLLIPKVFHSSLYQICSLVFSFNSWITKYFSTYSSLSKKKHGPMLLI